MVAERERFEQLWHSCSGQILGYALRRAVDRDTAYDVLNETFVVAWRRIDEVPPGDEGRLWLYGVARRVLANTRRSQQRRLRLDAKLRAHAPGIVAGAMCDDAPDEQLDAIAAALAALRPDDRELLTLVAWDGLRADELGTVIGCSAATARVRLHRARRRLELELQQAGVQRPAGTGHVSARALARPAPEES